MINVTVSLQEKREIYQAVMQYTDINGKQQQKWKSTKVRIIKGQKKQLKKQAEEMLKHLEKILNLN